MKRMLINATQPEELRVAIVDGQTLYDLDIEIPSREQKKSNIYKGRITRVEPSLEACFVDFGAERHGFLPMKEIAREYYRDDVKGQSGRVSIKEAIKEGQEVIVQVDKEERGTKGAALTTFISLAGRYMVLMPNNPRAGGVSRRIEGEEREAMRQTLRQVETPKGMGLIVRTAGVGREADELNWDLNYLTQVWQAIKTAAAERKAPFLIYQDSSLIIRALRDYLRSDIGEILVDDTGTHNDAQEFMQQVMPHNLRKLKLYQDATPLFSRYQIESQIESAYAREVRLPSGGSIVIDHTEAMVAIDINSARATKGSDIEETATNTNLEAADEVARQLRIRDMGGLVVIDFIDMMENRNQRAVEDRLRKALQMDRARVQVGRISRFGLLEMSRQRLRPSLGEATQSICPRCDGQGTIRSVESLALSVLRLVEEEVMKEQTGEVIAQVPTKVGNFLLNEKRHALSQIEVRHRVPILVINNEYMETPKFEIRRVRRADLRLDGPASYTLSEAPEPELVAAHTPHGLKTTDAVPAPAVQAVVPAQPAPERSAAEVSAAAAAAAPSTGGMFGWFKKLFGSSDDAETEPAKPAAGKGKPNKKARDGQRNNARRKSNTKTGTKGGKGSQKQAAKGGKQQQANKSGQQKKEADNRKRGGQQNKDGNKSRKPQDARKDNRKDARKDSAEADGNKTNQAQGANATDAQQDGNRPSTSKRRRGRRGGRRRRGGANRNAAQNGAQDQNANQADGQSTAQTGAVKNAEQTSSTSTPAAGHNKSAANSDTKAATPSQPEGNKQTGAVKPQRVPPAGGDSAPRDVRPQATQQTSRPKQPAGSKDGGGQADNTPKPASAQRAASQDSAPTKSAPAAPASTPAPKPVATDKAAPNQAMTAKPSSGESAARSKPAQNTASSAPRNPAAATGPAPAKRESASDAGPNRVPPATSKPTAKPTAKPVVDAAQAAKPPSSTPSASKPASPPAPANPTAAKPQPSPAKPVTASPSTSKPAPQANRSSAASDSKPAADKQASTARSPAPTVKPGSSAPSKPAVSKPAPNVAPKTGAESKPALQQVETRSNKRPEPTPGPQSQLPLEPKAPKKSEPSDS